MGKRSTTPGVRLYKRVRASGAVTWYGRVDDPIQGTRHVNLTRLGLLTPEQRMEWAKARSRDVLRLRAASVGVVSAGAAGETYMQDVRRRLRARTVAAYQRVVDRLVLALGEDRSLATVTAADLWVLRGELVGEGTTATTRNSHLRRLGAALEWWRRAGWLPLVSRDDIHDALRKEREPQPIPTVLCMEECQEAVRAALVHDEETRHPTKWGGTRARRAPAEPLVRGLLLTGCRLREWADLDWEEVDLDQRCLRLTTRTKTARARLVDLDVCPSVLALLEDQGPRRKGRVWGDRYRGTTAVRRLRERLVALGAPDVPWKALRSTCAGYLANAHGIGWTIYQVAAQLGHSVAVCERHYLGRVRGVPREAKTLEQAMGLEEVSG